MIKVSFKKKDFSDFIKMALRVESDEFLKLTKDAVQLLAVESSNFQIVGSLVKLPASGEAIIVGDIHGDLESLAHILKSSNFVAKASEGEDLLLVFLGDYGDRGFYSPEVYYVVLKLKEMLPQNVLLMRGNHEGPDDILAYPHDLPLHLNRKFGKAASEIYFKLRELFNYLLNAVWIEERYILLHGGVPSMASNVDDLAYAHEKHPRESHLEEILWSDPREGITGTYPSTRGAGKFFGEDVTEKFLKMLNVNALIRGHESSEEGFIINHAGKVLTLFSRRGAPYYNSHGAYLHLDLTEVVEDVKQIKQSIHKF